MGGHHDDGPDASRSVVVPLVHDIEAILAPVDDGDRWGQLVRDRLATTWSLTPVVGEVLALWAKATGTNPTKTWLRRDDELRRLLPDGEVTALAGLLLAGLLEVTLPGDEREAVKRRQAAAYDLLRTMKREQDAKRAGQLRYIGPANDRTTAAWAASVNRRIEALPTAIRQGSLFGVANSDLLRGAVWAAARHPTEVPATAALLAAVAEHGVDTNRGLEPGTEVMQAGKAVNACIAMLATLPDRAGAGALDRLAASITNGHHAKRIAEAIAALDAH